MFVVVAYDIPDDRRRTRLHQKLKNYGTPVQYSVFEFNLRPAQLRRMRQTVLELIEEEDDQVRIYLLCQSCRERIEAVNGDITSDETTMIV